MLKLTISFGFFICGFIGAIFSPNIVHASNASPVISSVQTGASAAATQEYISVYNNSAVSIDVTGWCVVYSSSSDATQTTLGCLNAPDTSTKIWLSSHSYFTAGSNEFVAAHVGFTPDITFNSGMAATGGHVKLIDAHDTKNKIEVDRVGYGTADHPDGTVVAAPATDKVLQRIGTTTLQDTNNNAADFGQTTLGTLPSSGLYEVVTVVDVCPNIDGVQATMPARYLADSDGNCQKDVCANVDNLQVTIPDGYESLDGVNCTLIPPENATLLITELLPNSASYDTGNEFIEIYNPNDRVINLKGYNLQLGPSFSKSYPLPADQTIAAKSYKAFSDSQTGLVLPNSSGFVRLTAPAGNTVSTTDIYSEPGEDMAWALLNDAWQYTDQPTPSSANLPSLAGGGSGGSTSEIVADLTPCPADKYRNPETNRCKNIEDSTTGLTPCAADQVRNPATNRCRSILSTASSGLVACSAGQERNPETNRCRKIGSTTVSSLTPCVANEERNPATNRCRKKSASSIAAKAIQDIESQTMADRGGWFLAGSAGMGLAGYGVAEWRSEIVTGLRRISALLGKNPPEL